MDQDRLESLTMRRVADDLKVDPMSLYNHVDGKEGILDGLAEAFWIDVELPAGEASWKEALRAFAISLRAVAHAHAYGLLCTRAIVAEPALRVIDAVLASLQGPGLSREQAAEMLRTLFAYAVGYGKLELSATPAAGTTGRSRSSGSPALCRLRRRSILSRSPN